MQYGAKGWAVIDGHLINVRTVSPTRLAAITNWLVVERNQFITNDTPNERIELAWLAAKGSATVHEVFISCDPGGPDPE